MVKLDVLTTESTCLLLFLLKTKQLELSFKAFYIIFACSSFLILLDVSILSNLNLFSTTSIAFNVYDPAHHNNHHEVLRTSGLSQRCTTFLLLPAALRLFL